jgi:hypothetical protein
MTANGNFFESIGQEIRRIPEMAAKFTSKYPNRVESFAMRFVLAMMGRMSAADHGSAAWLNHGYHVRAVKRHNPT